MSLFWGFTSGWPRREWPEDKHFCRPLRQTNLHYPTPHIPNDVLYWLLLVDKPSKGLERNLLPYEHIQLA